MPSQGRGPWEPVSRKQQNYADAPVPLPRHRGSSASNILLTFSWFQCYPEKHFIITLLLLYYLISPDGNTSLAVQSCKARHLGISGLQGLRHHDTLIVCTQLDGDVRCSGLYLPRTFYSTCDSAVSIQLDVNRNGIFHLSLIQSIAVSQQFIVAGMSAVATF